MKQHGHLQQRAALKKRTRYENNRRHTERNEALDGHR